MSLAQSQKERGDKRFPTFTISVKQIPCVSYAVSALYEMSNIIFKLKWSIFKEQEFQTYYNRCIERALQRNDESNPFEGRKIIQYIEGSLIDSFYSDLYYRIYLVYPSSCAIIKLSETNQYILITHMLRAYILCNPLHSTVFIGDTEDILQYLYTKYANSNISLTQY
jgi:hypothetical protein